MTVLDDASAAAFERLCDLFVPGSSRVGPSVYADALLDDLYTEVKSVWISLT